MRRNLWTIVGKLWPGARLAYRTAFEYAPHEGRVFLGYKYTRRVVLPGVIIHFIATPDSLPSDYPFMEGLGVSSHARAVLENLEPDRTQGGVEKCLPVETMEERLEAEFAAGGEVALDTKKGAEVDISNPDSPELTTSETKPGLTYTLRKGKTLDGMADGDIKVGDGKKWTPNITVKGGTSGFYTIKVEK